ncbi:hypothetical protein ACFPRL_17445 [Pseudoclavibacter helvolus]
MRAEAVLVVDGCNPNLGLHLRKKLDDSIGMRQRVGRVGQHDGACFAELVERLREGCFDGALVGERGVALLQFFGPCLFHDSGSAPVDAQSFEEVIALDVIGIVFGRGIRRIKVDDV